MDYRRPLFPSTGTMAVMLRLLFPAVQFLVRVGALILFPATRCAQIWQCCSVAENFAFVLTCSNVLIAIWIMLQGPGSTVWHHTLGSVLWHHASNASLTEGGVVLNMAMDIGPQWTERPDFALYTTGGNIITELTTPHVIPGERSSLSFNWARGRLSSTPDFPWPGKGPMMAIHWETQPGHCWSLPGSSGDLGVSLSKRIFVDGVAVEHVPAQLTWDITDAPRRMEVWGLLVTPADIERAAGSQEAVVRRSRSRFGDTASLRLAQFEYDIHSSLSVQRFAVDAHIRALSVAFDTVVLNILDNWGNQDSTCLYRFRVYGELATKVADASATPEVAA